MLSIDELKKEQIEYIINQANILFKNKKYIDLSKLIIASIFYEDSTRTRCSFEIAAKLCNAKIINIDVKNSSLNKGETLLSMLENLEIMGVNCFIIRCDKSNILKNIKKKLKKAIIINAGDGMNEHPSQALIDFGIIKKYKKNLSTINIGIIGDINHSRVINSNIKIFHKYNIKNIFFSGPYEYIKKKNNIIPFDKLIKISDVIILLRIQNERISKSLKFLDIEKYNKLYGITKENIKFLKNDCIIIHPGPVNFGVEIDEYSYYHKKSKILEQVKYSIYLRISILKYIFDQIIY